MSWKVNKFYIFTVWFLALNGNTRYYPNLQTGQLHRSWFLQLYSMVYSMLSVCGMPALFVDRLAGNPTLAVHVHSNWVTYANWFYVFLNMAVMLSCIYCAQFLQCSIYRIIGKLQTLEQISLPAITWRHHDVLLYIKLTLVSNYIILQIYYVVWQKKTSTLIQMLVKLWKFGTTTMTTATSMLIYLILWKISYFGMCLQKRLEQLLTENEDAQLEDLQQLYKQLLRLIDVTNEFCITFRHLMFWYPMRILCNGVLSVYFIIRIHFGSENPELTLGLSLLILFVCLHAYAEFYVTNCVAGAVGDIIPNVIAVFRQSKPQDLFVERASSWMAMQLGCQSTEINLFGVVTLNRHLWFCVMAQIVLHTLYMIQSDYYFM